MQTEVITKKKVKPKLGRMNKQNFFVVGIINQMVYFYVAVFIFIYTNINLLGKVS
ncbi:hypothetical protein [Neobacillus sp.]|uniref:hypothetical protein n=1 Tax=Neobacillus sp. TaxID=2675273 RepID=UPI00289C3952|nr:hypothetical protein [Neobacillus sp.]